MPATRQYTFSIESHLATPREEVWAHASSMRGVNRELMPVVRMTYPKEAEQLDITAAPLGEVLFTSTLLLFGFIPFDRHYLCLESLTPGEGFRERSTSIQQRVWIHERGLRDIPGGCAVRDEIAFCPRIAMFGPLLAPVIRAVFRKRHATLRRCFGELR